MIVRYLSPAFIVWCLCIKCWRRRNYRLISDTLIKSDADIAPCWLCWLRRYELSGAAWPYRVFKLPLFRLSYLFKFFFFWRWAWWSHALIITALCLFVFLSDCSSRWLHLSIINKQLIREAHLLLPRVFLLSLAFWWIENLFLEVNISWD